MAFIFTMRSAGHGREMGLPAIAEDGDDPFVEGAAPAPNVPQYPHAPQANRRQYPYPNPLPYQRPSPVGSDRTVSAFSDTDSTANGTREKPLIAALRNNKQIARRGGWKRLAIVAVVVVLCLVGLIVGLVVGLRNRNNSNNNSTPWTSTTSWLMNTTYPAGNYSIQTFLASTATNCTTNAATWRCYPYETYAANPTAAPATLDWMIYAFTSSSQSTPTYTVSTTNNPFSINFHNVTLALVDANLTSERYVFNVTTNKPVIPTAALTSANVAATCYFNQTVFQGALYTRMNRTYPSTTTTNATSAGAGGTAFPAWPYALAFEQLADASSMTPDCRDTAGNELGNFTVQTAGEECQCVYMNYGQ